MQENAQRLGRNAEFRHPLEHHFERFATTVSRWAGHSVAFAAAVILVSAWAVSGPLLSLEIEARSSRD